MKKPLAPMLEDPTLSSDVRELLQAGRDAYVNDYDYSAGLSAHLGHIEAGTPMPDWAKGLEGSGGVGTAATTAAGVKLIAWLTLPLIGAGVATAVWLGRAEPETERPAVPASGQVAPVEAAQPAPGTPTSAVPSSTAEGAINAHAAAAVEPAGPITAVEAVERRASAPRVRATSPRLAVGKRTERVATDSAAASSGVPSGVSPTGESRAVAEAPAARSTTRAATSVVARTENAQQPEPVAPLAPAAAEPAAEEEQQAALRPEAAPQVDDGRLEREMGMLSVAQRVLHSDPGRALSMARQGEREFPRSMFTQERQQLELLALVKLGKLEEAKRLARPYLARYPHGPFSDRVRRALATGRVER